MGILSKAKSKLKSVVSTAAKKITSTVSKAVGGGSGGGGGGSWSASKVNNTASAAGASAGNKSVVPTKGGTSSSVSSYGSTKPAANYGLGPTKSTSVAELAKTVNNLKAGITSGSMVPTNQSRIPSPSSTQIVTDPKTGKTSIKNVNSKLNVQGAIDSATGGKSGGSSRVSSSATTLDAPLETVSSYGATDTFGLNDIELAAMDSFASTMSSSPSTYSAPTSTTKTSSGAGGASSPTSQRGANTVSARDAAIASAKAEAERLSKEVGILAKQEETAAQDAVVSDTPEVQEESDALKFLKEDVGTDSLKVLNDELKQMRSDLRDQEKTIGKAYDVKQTGMTGEQAGETGQTSAALASAGGYLGFSGSAQGVMLSLAESHRAELVSLESERQNALQEARTAAANRRFDIVRLKADEIARIDQETYERTKEYHTEVKKEADKKVEEEKTLKTQNDIFKAITGGAKTVEAIFNKLGGKTDANDIKDVLENLTSSTGSFKFSANETAGLLGAGMPSADISTLLDYVNENGYTEEVRSQLTPAQRAAADKIFREKISGDNTPSFIAPDGTAISSTTMQILDGLSSVKDLTPTMQAKVKSELYSLGFGDKTVPDWFTPEFMEEAGYSSMPAVNPLLQYAIPDYGGTANLAPSAVAIKKLHQDNWNKYRIKTLGTGSSKSGSSDFGTSIDDLDFDSLN